MNELSCHPWTLFYSQDAQTPSEFDNERPFACAVEVQYSTAVGLAAARKRAQGGRAELLRRCGSMMGTGGVVMTAYTVSLDHRFRIPTLPGQSDMPGFRPLRLRVMKIMILGVSHNPCVAIPN